jgi:hypothetical protein
MAKHYKSEKLKKLESELLDLKHWQKLGLVPKKDIPKHESEIKEVQEKIQEEIQRIEILKETGDLEEIVPSKKASGRTAYTEMPTLPDINGAETTLRGDIADTEEEVTLNEETKEGETEEVTHFDEDEESYFSDRSRWRRGGILDPEKDDW